MAEAQEKPAGRQILMKILSEAVASAADVVELECDSDGSLEVSFVSGNTGAGYCLDGETGGEVLESLSEEKKKARGKKFRVTLDGKDHMVQVQTYDHFGEDAYRLTVREAK